MRLNFKGLHSTGVGLGLSIVEKISQALGLELHMSSAISKGTTLRFQIALVSPEADMVSL